MNQTRANRGSQPRGIVSMIVRNGKAPPRMIAGGLRGFVLPFAAKGGTGINGDIGRQLRLFYGEVVDQGVPDRFAAILRGLDGPSDGGPNDELR